MKRVVFLNGKFIKPEEARISALTPGFLCGMGVFETMRACRNKIIYLEAHLKRLKDSCRLVGLRLPYPAQKLKKIISEALKKGNFKDAHIRLTLWKEEAATGILILAKEYKPYSPGKYKNGIRLTVSTFRQNENSFFARIKTTNRLLYELSYRQARKKGFDGAIILNRRGYVSEGTRSNIFLVKDNVLFTPDLSCGCLAGITRKVIFALAGKYKIRIEEGKFTLQDLYQADEVFFTNSLAGIMPVAFIERKRIGKGKCGRLTKFFLTKYRSLLK